VNKRRNKDNQRQPVSQPPKSAENLRQIVRQEISAQFTFSGPLPPPAILAQYNEAVPDGAERIIVMAETQAKHRMALESRVVDADIRRANWGLAAGFVVALVFLLVSFLLIDRGKEWPGAALGAIDLVGLVGVFIYGTISRRSEREQRVKMMSGES